MYLMPRLKSPKLFRYSNQVLDGHERDGGVRVLEDTLAIREAALAVKDQEPVDVAVLGGKLNLRLEALHESAVSIILLRENVT